MKSNKLDSCIKGGCRLCGRKHGWFWTEPLFIGFCWGDERHSHVEVRVLPSRNMQVMRLSREQIARYEKDELVQYAYIAQNQFVALPVNRRAAEKHVRDAQKQIMPWPWPPPTKDQRRIPRRQRVRAVPQ